MDVYTTHHQPAEPGNDTLTALHEKIFQAVKEQKFLFAERFLEWFAVCFSVDCPLLSTTGSSFLPLGSPPCSALPLLSSPQYSPPSPALASNGLNRLASCQSRGLLWLCHKSARKNRNHLFRPGPGSGWGCKYMSLALALSPARAHWTTEPSGGLCTQAPTQPALPTAVML